MSVRGDRWRRGSFVALAVLAAAALLAACGASKPTSAPTTSSVATTTSTTVPCHGQPSQGSQGTATVTVTPGTCLKGRQVVTITGSGLKPNSPGGISECNGTSQQPTVSVEGSQVPVGCTNPLAQTVMTSSTGTLEATFPIVTGITGPPASAADSAGRPSLKDAPAYPCPPTSAQAASGVTCNIAFGDAGGDQVSVTISFVPNAKPSATKAGRTLSPSVPLG